MDFSIVVPVYNGEHTVKTLCKSINAYFLDTNYLYEVIFVHDCGKDNSLSVLLDLQKKEDYAKVIQLSRNYGQQQR